MQLTDSVKRVMRGVRGVRGVRDVRRVRRQRRVQRRLVFQLVVVVEPHLLLVVGRARLAPVPRAQEGRHYGFAYYAAAYWNEID